MEFEGEAFYIHCIKEEKYVTKFMSTHGVLNEVPGHKAWRRTSTGEVHEWTYVEPNSRHNRAKHWVDDHNNKRHSPLDLGQLWNTKYWPHRQFAFLMAVSEVNAVNSKGRATGKEAESVLAFRKKLSLQLLNCELDEDGGIMGGVDPRVTRARLVMEAHRLETRPPYTTGTWLHDHWKPAKQRHQKSMCKCKKWVRTYCTCDPATTMCQSCYSVHCAGL